MPYMIETCAAGRTFEVCKYYTYRYNVKGEKRSKRAKPTSEAQKKINQRMREKELRRLMNENFADGDSLVRLDFSKEHYPVGSEDMQKMIEKFIDNLRKEFRKQDRELKYIYVKEIGKRGGRHVHILMSKVDTETLMKCWPHGGIHLDPLISGGQYAKIAAYFIKYAQKTEETEGKLIGKRWYASRNLTRPEPEKEVISAASFRKTIKPMEGYVLDKESVQSGISEFTGYGYFSYTLIRIEDRIKGTSAGKEAAWEKGKAAREKEVAGKKEKPAREKEAAERDKPVRKKAVRAGKELTRKEPEKLNRVDIYINTDIRGPRARDGTAWYILETETSRGPANVGDKLRLEQSTEKQAELTALLAAARRIRGACELHIFTESQFLAAGWRLGWIEGWKKNGWKTSKGEPVAFYEMWQELDQILSIRPTEFHIGEHHSYSSWFKFEEKREKERRDVREVRRV